MNFNLLKTRRGKLKIGLAKILDNEGQIENVLNLVDEYEKDNLETIEKFKRDKTIVLRKINGALKQTINTHGPITKNLIGSASKRIYGVFLTPKSSDSILQSFLKLVKKIV